jgi:hypothetical protein
MLSALVQALAVLLAAAPAPSAQPAAPAPAEPPAGATAASGAIAFQVGEDRAGRCVLTPRTLPPAAYVCTVLDAARMSVPDLDLRAVGLEVDDGRPILVVRLAPAAGGPGKSDGGPTLARFCAAAREAAAGVEGTGSGDPAAGPLLKRVWTARHAFEPGKGTVQFRSIQRIRRAGETIGWVEYWIGARPGGNRYLLSRTAMVTQRGPAARQQCLDGSHVEDTDARGMLVSGVYAQLVDGEIRYRVRLSRGGERAYDYDGQAREKPLHGRIETREGLATALVRMALFRESTGFGPAEPVHQEAYVPGIDPARPVAVVLRKDPARPRGIVIEMGPKRTAGSVDADGVFEWAEQEGNPPLRFETVFRTGSP